MLTGIRGTNWTGVPHSAPSNLSGHGQANGETIWRWTIQILLNIVEDVEPHTARGVCGRPAVTADRTLGGYRDGSDNESEEAGRQGELHGGRWARK